MAYTNTAMMRKTEKRNTKKKADFHSGTQNVPVLLNYWHHKTRSFLKPTVPVRTGA